MTTSETRDRAISAYIPANDDRAMRQWCADNERSVSFFIRKAIDTYLESVGYRNIAE